MAAFSSSSKLNNFFFQKICIIFEQNCSAKQTLYSYLPLHAYEVREASGIYCIQPDRHSVVLSYYNSDFISAQYLKNVLIGIKPNFAYAFSLTRSMLGLVRVNFRKFAAWLLPLVIVKISFSLNRERMDGICSNFPYALTLTRSRLGL